jgi:hypothetical protein
MASRPVFGATFQGYYSVIGLSIFGRRDLAGERLRQVAHAAHPFNAKKKAPTVEVFIKVWSNIQPRPFFAPTDV